MPDDHDLAMKFAPMMNLHPNEKYLPMDPADFVQDSRLWIVREDKGIAVYDPDNRKWDEDPDNDSHFGFPPRLLTYWEALHGSDDGSWSRRPHDKKIPQDGERFVLEHYDNKPTARFNPASPPPCFYHVQQWKDSILISYWFFYGYSQFVKFVAHQGDWEHATLRIRNGEIVSGFYAVHEDKHYVEAEDLNWRGDRLQVFSAKYRHATWWKAGNHMPGVTFFQKKEEIGNIRSADRRFLQDETGNGPVWDLRANLQPLEEQPWRLFGGAWGMLGDAPHTTGPLGPWFKRHLDPEEKVVME